jgi:hypothetical protein
MIEAARNVSRAKNSPMWTNFYWEGAKKTALRRAAKQAPFSSELRRVLDRDEEAPEIGPDPGPGLLPSQPEPQREQYQIGRAEPTDGPEFAVVDLDGVEHVYASAGAACEAMRLLLDEAARLGADRLDGWWESNQATIDFLAGAGHGDAVVALIRAYEQRRAKQQQAPSSEMVEEDGYPGSLVPRRSRRTRESEAPAAEPPAEKQTPHAPPTGAADDDPFGLAELGHHRMPPTEEPPPVSGLEIAPPLKNGKRDWRTWALALFAVKVRRCSSSNELADLLGANEQNLEEARAALVPADLAELERIIAEQWQKVPAT